MKNINTSLIVWGTSLPSNINHSRFTKIVASMIEFPPFIKSFIYGILLSDGWLNFAAKHNKNARLGFGQSLAHFAYCWHVFNNLAHYCSSLPAFRIKDHKKSFFGVQILTRALPCFTELYTLWYKEGIKIIPADIFDYLTPVCLAEWIQGDGATIPSGLILCTDSYTIQDVVRLMNVLIIKYEFVCSLREHRKGQFRIYISAKSLPKLRSIVLPYMSKSMLYKIHL